MHFYSKTSFIKKRFNHFPAEGSGLALVIPRSHEDIAQENYLASQSNLQDMDDAVDVSRRIVEQILAMARSAVEAQSSLRSKEAAALLV